MIKENGFAVASSPLEKRRFSMPSAVPKGVTGCYDDDFDDLKLNNDPKHLNQITQNHSPTDPLSSLRLDYEHTLLNYSSTAHLYERRKSSVFDYSKSKTTQRIKRRRQGIVVSSAIPEIDNESEAPDALTSVQNVSLQIEDSNALVSVNFDHNQNRTRQSGYLSVNGRDSGFSDSSYSSGFDNLGFENSTESNTSAI